MNQCSRARRICLRLPEATEKEAWGAPTFRVRDRMFAMFVENHHGDGRIALWCSALQGAQKLLVDSDPERFFVPPYVGPKGWVGIHLDRSNDALVADTVMRAYCAVAPPNLREKVEQMLSKKARGPERARGARAARSPAPPRHEGETTMRKKTPETVAGRSRGSAPAPMTQAGSFVREGKHGARSPDAAAVARRKAPTGGSPSSRKRAEASPKALRRESRRAAKSAAIAAHSRAVARRSSRIRGTKSRREAADQ